MTYLAWAHKWWLVLTHSTQLLEDGRTHNRTHSGSFSLSIHAQWPRLTWHVPHLRDFTVQKILNNWSSGSSLFLWMGQGNRISWKDLTSGWRGVPWMLVKLDNSGITRPQWEDHPQGQGEPGRALKPKRLLISTFKKPLFLVNGNISFTALSSTLNL